MKRLSHKLADITNDYNDDNDNNSTHGHRHKRRRTRHESPPVDSDEEETDTGNVVDERFVYHTGHKFFLICAPWIHSGDNIFDTDIDKCYDAAERFENDENKKYGQLKEIIGLLQGKFQRQALRQGWLRRQVSSIYILQCCTHSLLVY